jgi:hypothetical protein
MQKLFEDLALQMMDHYLGDILRETGRLAFAGGGALNVKLNQKIIARPEVKELFVQPASGDAGTAIGAASYVSVQRGVPVEKMEHVYLGPAYSNEEVIAACARTRPSRNGKDRRGAAAHRPPARRRQPGGLVPGPHGVRPARPGRPLHPRLPERARRRRPHQRTDQVPRTLAAVLPEHARHGRAADARQRPPGALHDLHLRGRRRMEERVCRKSCTRTAPRAPRC